MGLIAYEPFLVTQQCVGVMSRWTQTQADDGPKWIADLAHSIDYGAAVADTAPPRQAGSRVRRSLTSVLLPYFCCLAGGE
jgi:hypothetical protein